MTSRKKGEGLKSPRSVASSEMPAKISRNLSSSSSSSSSLSSSSISSPEANSFVRQQRNQAEKKRRDKLNSYITELAALVPMIYDASKRPDKTGILRLSAAYLRLHYSSLNPRNFQQKFEWRPKVLCDEQLGGLMQAIKGFFVLATPSGKILYISKSVETDLGHHDIEMIGHSLFDFIHPADIDLAKSELKALFSMALQRKNDLSDVRGTFVSRIQERKQARSEVVTYQVMQFHCCLTLNEGTIRTSTKQALVTESNGTALESNYSGLLKIHIKPLKMNLFNELSITEAFQEEYITRHGPDGKILFADHRIATITGHLPHEVIGMLAYDYINPVDISVTQFAQNLMFSSSNGTGMIVYRLKTKNETMVYLKTIGHLQYDSSSTKISHFVCVNKLLSRDEGENELVKFRERYSPRISEFLALLKSDQLPGMESCDMAELLNVTTQRSENSRSMPSIPSPEFHDYHRSIPPSTSFSTSFSAFPTTNTYDFDLCQKQSVEIQPVCSSATQEMFETSSKHLLEIGNKSPVSQNPNNNIDNSLHAQFDLRPVEKCTIDSNGCDVTLKGAHSFKEHSITINEVNSRKRCAMPYMENEGKNLPSDGRKGCKIMRFNGQGTYVKTKDTTHANLTSVCENKALLLNDFSNIYSDKKPQHHTSLSKSNSSAKLVSNIPSNDSAMSIELSGNGEVLHSVPNNQISLEHMHTIDDNSQSENCLDDEQILDDFDGFWGEICDFTNNLL